MNKVLLATTITTLIFLLCIVFDVSPFFRGPAPYAPDWRWPYQIPTLSWKIFYPFLTGGLLITTVIYQLKKSFIKKLWHFFAVIILLGLIFQHSLLFSSNAGISVLIHRMINPMISGYFTTATQITSISDFLRNFNDSFNFYPLFGRFHPPFDILFYYLINKAALYITPFFPVINTLSPTHDDVAIIWSNLFAYEKIGAILGVLTTQLLSFATIIPLYFAAKNIFNERSALIAISIYVLTPSILLFSPLADTTYPFFTATAFYFLTQAISSKRYNWLFLSGLTLSIGALFSLTILPLLLLFAIYYCSQIKNVFSHKKELMIQGSIAFAGFLLPLLILQVFFHLDIKIMIERTMLYHNLTQSGRNYFTWTFYSPYDFFIFLGIPTTILFFSSLKKKFFSKNNALALSFIVLILTLDLLGSVKGETGRVWIPYTIFPILVAASFLTKKTNKTILCIFFLLSLHTIIFNFFLVTLW